MCLCWVNNLFHLLDVFLLLLRRATNYFGSITALQFFSPCWPLCVIARNDAVILFLHLFKISNITLRSVLTDSHFFFSFASGNSSSVSIIGYRLEGYSCLLIPPRQIWSNMFRSLAFWCFNKLCRHLLPKDLAVSHHLCSCVYVILTTIYRHLQLVDTIFCYPRPLHDFRFLEVPYDSLVNDEFIWTVGKNVRFPMGCAGTSMPASYFMRSGRRQQRWGGGWADLLSELNKWKETLQH